MVTSCGFETALNIACSESLKSLNLVFASATATTWRTKKYTKTSSLLRAKTEKKILFLKQKKAASSHFPIIVRNEYFNNPLGFTSGISQKYISNRL